MATCFSGGRTACAVGVSAKFEFFVRAAWLFVTALAIFTALTGPAKAGSAAIGFSGYVLPQQNSPFALEQDELVVFGEVAGVRFLAVNRNETAAHLNLSVVDAFGSIVTQGARSGLLLPPGLRLATTIVFPVGVENHQRFRLCAEQVHADGNTSNAECFEIAVTRLD